MPEQLNIRISPKEHDKEKEYYEKTRPDSSSDDIPMQAFPV
jgi:hypothetical protein